MALSGQPKYAYRTFGLTDNLTDEGVWIQPSTGDVFIDWAQLDADGIVKWQLQLTQVADHNQLDPTMYSTSRTTFSTSQRSRPSVIP